MKKKWLALGCAAICAAALVVAGCSSSTTSSSSSSSSGAQTSTTSDKLEDTLVVYSTHPEAMLEQLAKEFEEKYGTKVEFINLKGGLADRVLSEKDNPQADVMYGGDISVYDQLSTAGCFEATSPDWASELPSSYKSTKGDWYATIKTPVVMFYNTNLISESDAPKDWSDLTDSKYEGQIVARDYNSSSMRSAVCNLYYYYNQKGGETAAVDYLKALNANIKNYYNSGTMMFKAIGNGDASIGIGTLNDVITNRDTNGMPLAYVNATSGDIIISDCVAAIKGAAHPNAAAKWVEFVGSKEIEVELAKDYSRMPILESALKESPEWMQANFDALPVDWVAIAENQTSWLDTWQNQIYSNDKTVSSS